MEPLILLDTNIWVALALSGHEFHGVCRSWFASQSGSARMFFCRSTQQSFLRLLTMDSVVRRYGVVPFTNAAAWSLMGEFFEDTRIAFAAEPAGIDPIWKSLTTRRSASPKLWMDAYLAAFAIAGKHQLVTADKGFSQFPRLDALIL